MFGNKGYRWKLAAALAVIALLGVVALRRGDSINPALWRCLAEPARWEGKALWIPAAVIVSGRENDYEIATSDVRIRVDGRPPGSPGLSIGLQATFRQDGPHLDPVRTRTLPPRSRLRWLMEAVSVAVLLGVLANFARHFLFRPKLLQFSVEEPPNG